ncbi:hypothetical protein BC829DRAFT_382532 [Chytridium lagenaria]|nr:hypothetical protein BC829DRAFT_382532 [Chytridium lagenaria]
MDFYNETAPSHDYETEEYEEETSPSKGPLKTVTWTLTDAKPISFKLLIVSFPRPVSKLLQTYFPAQQLGTVTVPEEKDTPVSDYIPAHSSAHSADGLGLLDCDFPSDPVPDAVFDLVQGLFKARFLIIDSAVVRSSDSRHIFTLKTSKGFEIHASVMTLSEIQSIPAVSYILPVDIDVDFLLHFSSIAGETFLRTVIRPKPESSFYL